MNKSVIRKMVGKQVYAVHKRGGKISGKLVRISGNRIYLQPTIKSGKKVRTSAIIPLALFDLLAIGTSPYTYGGYPYGGGYGYPYGGGYGGGYGYPYGGVYPGAYW